MATAPVVTAELAPLRTVCGHLEDLGAMCERVMEAMQKGNAQRVSELVHETRAIRADLARAQIRARDVAMPATQEGLVLLQRLKLQAERVSIGDEVIKLWLDRPRPTDAELLASRDGRAWLIDAMLPLVWDVHADVVLLAGIGGEPLAYDLVALGQKRIVAYLPVDAPTTGYPACVVPATTHLELKHAILSFAAPAPERAVSKLYVGGGFDHEEHVKIAQTALDAVEESRVHLATINTFGERWAMQGLQNLPDLAARPSVGALDGLFAGKPLVIVSPGPSLIKNIEVLKQWKGKALIFSFCQTLKALRAAGVQPDIVMATDPQDLRYLFEGHPMEEVPALLLAATVHPTLFKLPAQRIFSVQANSSLDNWLYDLLGERMRVPSAGSVACSAFTLGIMWHCDPIILVGQDLAYTDGRVYVPTSTDGEARVKLVDDGKSFETANWCAGAVEMARDSEINLTKQRRTVWLPGYHGGEVPTSFSYALFHRFFRNVSLDLAKERPSLRLWNCTEGGAYIEGMEHLPLTEALERGKDEWQALDVPGKLDEAIGRIDADARCKRLLDTLVMMRSALERSVAQADRCRRTAELASLNTAHLPRLDREEKVLHQHLAPVLFISLIRQTEIAEAVAEGRKAKTTARNLDAAMRLYGVIIEAGRVLREPMDHAIAELRRRVEEKRRAA